MRHKTLKSGPGPGSLSGHIQSCQFHILPSSPPSFHSFSPSSLTFYRTSSPLWIISLLSSLSLFICFEPSSSQEPFKLHKKQTSCPNESFYTSGEKKALVRECLPSLWWFGDVASTNLIHVYWLSLPLLVLFCKRALCNWEML